MEQQQWDRMLRYVCLGNDDDRLQVLGSMINVGIDNRGSGTWDEHVPSERVILDEGHFSFIGAIDTIDLLTILR